ncbi:Membrane-bound lytic murein transglycosylase D [Pandoraea pneumonica]|jgi:hypothetical protein|uniref:Membrane-bound lytic murein transglycosylase D n=1 Tax=Pandoraea pneumonica TaxID=2508299 RepID=A0A5E4W3S2_9BURK|nr:lytic transglycosylase domain-containing protein [Pandoraea pneumonica]VVE19352.1 Membrane-bound lytic murein transglycosylase D [Pandoraea pneumonica]
MRISTLGAWIALALVCAPAVAASAQTDIALPLHPRMTDAGVEVPERKAPSKASTVPSPVSSPVPSPIFTADPAPASTGTTNQQLNAIAPAPSPSLPFDTLVQTTARDYSLDAALLHAMVSVESGYDALAVSPKGAIGLMQVRPQTGARFGFRRLEDPAENLRAGASYLQWLLTRFDGDLSLALAAYNAGEGAVLRYGRQVPPFRETQDYVRKVMAGYSRLTVMPSKNTETVVAPASPSATAATPTDVAKVRALPRDRRDGHGSRESGDVRAWQILRGLGALVTRSPSKRTAPTMGRDQPAVVMPASQTRRSP